MLHIRNQQLIIANKPVQERRSAGEGAENSAAQRLLYAEKFLMELQKCKCMV